MRWRRTLVRVAAGLTLALAFLALVGFLISFTGLYQTWAKGLLLRSIEARLRVGARVGEVTGNPLYEVSAKNLVLTRQGAPVLEAGNLTLSYFLPQVVLGTPVVRASLDNFTLNVVSTPRGTNLEGLLKPSTGGGANVVVSALSFHGGRVVYRRLPAQAAPEGAGAGGAAPTAAPTTVSDINVEGNLTLPATPREPLVIRLRQAAFRLNRPELVVRSATGMLSYGATRTSADIKAALTVAGAEVQATLRGGGVGGSLATAGVSGRLEEVRFHLPGPQPGGMSGQGGFNFDLAGNTLTLRQGQLQVPGATASFSGRVPNVSQAASGGNLDAHFQGRLQAADLARLTGRPQLGGKVDLDYRLTLERHPPGPVNIAFAAHSNQPSVGGIQLQSADIEATYRSPTLDIGRLTLSAPRWGRLTVSGPYTPGRALDLRYDFAATDVGPLASRLGAAKIATGSLRATGTLSGPTASPSAQGSFQGKDLSYGDLGAGQAGGSYRVADLFGERRGEVSARFTDLLAQGRRFPQAALTATLPERGTLQFRAQAKEGPNTAYRAEGRAEHLDQPQKSVRLATIEARLGRLTVRNTQEIPVIIDPAAVRLPNVALAATDNSLQATGSATVPGPVRLNLRFNHAPISEVTRLIKVNFPVDGTLDGPVNITGTTAQPRITADLAAASGAISGIPFERLRANVNYVPQQAHLKAQLTLPGGQAANLSGAVPMKVTLLPPSVESASARGLIQGLAQKALPRLFEQLGRSPVFPAP